MGTCVHFSRSLPSNSCGKRWLGGKSCQGRQPPKAGAAGPPLCGRHGPWIGGASPLRSELVATASRRQLHAGGSVARQSGLAPRGRVGKKLEGVLQHRTKVKPRTGRADRVSVPRNATPKIQLRSERY